jgi:hypothetical protein
MGFPIVAPPLPWGHDFNILNLHYVKKLSGKFYHFWSSGSWEKDFSMTLPLVSYSPDSRSPTRLHELGSGWIRIYILWPVEGVQQK